MFAETMRGAIDGARTMARLDDLSRAIWQGMGGGALTDEEAQGLAERLHAVRTALRSTVVPVGLPPGRPSLFPPRRYQRSPDRSASRSRRRLVASSGPMPPALASRFTTGELAVLGIVADELAQHGTCDLPVDAIAARAGVCRRLAQSAIRLAEGDGLLLVQERRREGAKNLTNLIRMLSREWSAWIKRRALVRARTTTGCKVMRPTGSQILDLLKSKPIAPLQEAAEGRGAGRAGPSVGGLDSSKGGAMAGTSACHERSA